MYLYIQEYPLSSSKHQVFHLSGLKFPIEPTRSPWNILDPAQSRECGFWLQSGVGAQPIQGAFQEGTMGGVHGQGSPGGREGEQEERDLMKPNSS